MSQILVGTQKTPFSHERFPITPDTMGAFSPLIKDHFIELFNHMRNPDLANFAIVNWTCKEVVERNTEWGERKRFFRVLPSLFKHMTVQDTLEYNGVRVDAEVSQYIYILHQHKLDKRTSSIPHILVKELDLSQQTEFSEVVGFAGSRLLVWLNQFDPNDQNKKFGTLQEINKETLQIETSHHFLEASLLRDITHIYLDTKFCIVTANGYCAIKMGKSTLRIAQEILKPLLGMRIDHFSIHNGPEGQMEVTLRGVRDEKNISMQHISDPFNPLQILRIPSS